MEGKMNKVILPVLAAGLLLAACAVHEHGGYYGGGYGGEVVVAPALPDIVILETDPYYYHSGHHYHYRNNAWYWSKSRSGPWKELPRDRWPKETRWKGNHHDERERGERRGHDRRD
jgi:hypothetical protein